MSTLRFRFTFNQGSQTASAAQARGAINAVMERVVFDYAKGTYDEVRDKIGTRVERDVMSEVSFMAGLFRRQVIGIGGSNAAPIGALGIAHEWARASQAFGLSASAQSGSGIIWPKRTDKYMAWKQQHFHHQRWFLNNNVVLKETLGSAKGWTGIFGPVHVSIRPLGGEKTIGKSPYLGQVTGGSHIVTGVANISVTAMGNLTPSMLPGLASGKMGGYGNGWNNGLMKMLPRAAALRLGGREHKYRRTIEPFLTFFLTRAVPNALFLRVEQGLKTQLSLAKRFG